MHVGEAVDRAVDLVAVNRATRSERVAAGHERAARGQRRDPEPQRRDDDQTPEHQPAHRGHRTPAPDRVEAEEQPHLGTTERGQRPKHERPSVALRQVEIDCTERERDDHRVRLEAQDVVPVVADAEQRDPGEHPGDDRGVAGPSTSAGQPVGDPPREDHAAQRDGSREDHPQPHLVVPDDRERHGEQVGQRLP